MRKETVDSIAQDILQYINSHDGRGETSIQDLLSDYWKKFGIRSRSLLYVEEPGLCEKMSEIEQQTLSQLT
ncbi:MAG: hypothetical protein EAX81_06525 [Candidatus Thorarchaeota archaeon]|nr:hypothetical protein [Candidatus Thorarchaeota archaeon]